MDAKLKKSEQRYIEEVSKIKGKLTLKNKIAAFKRCGFRERELSAIKKRIKVLHANAIISKTIMNNREARVGRPSDYKPEYCQAIIEFFSRPPFKPLMVKDDSGKEVVATHKNGSPVLVPCELPTKEGFAIALEVHTSTLYEWASKHDEFSYAMKRAENIQKNILIQNGLQGNYEARFAQFVAKNVTDMKDQQETINRTVTAEIPADANPNDAARIYQDLMNASE